MSKRFVRILAETEPKALGVRLRVDYDPDGTDAFGIYDEKVLPEKANDPDCHHVQALGNVELSFASLPWLYNVLGELTTHLGRNGARLHSLELAQAIEKIRQHGKLMSGFHHRAYDLAIANVVQILEEIRLLDAKVATEHARKKVRAAISRSKIKRGKRSKKR